MGLQIRGGRPCRVELNAQRRDLGETGIEGGHGTPGRVQQFAHQGVAGRVVARPAAQDSPK